MISTPDRQAAVVLIEEVRELRGTQAPGLRADGHEAAHP